MTVLVALLLFIQVTTPSSTPSPVHERCIAVPGELLEWVSAGILPETQATLGQAWMVKSEDFENVWFVAADLEGPELDGPDHVALWATNGPEEDGSYAAGDGGLVLSVDGFASEFSDWLPADEYDVSPDADGAELAVDCARGEE